MPIQVLDERTVRQIAAGEVVERPASVVKELVENSLDAGATVITVHLRDGGRTLISVVDDGCGIPQQELHLAFARHATSKIRSFDDVGSCTTFGFRGEALPSIAAVADVRCLSRAAGSGRAFAVDAGPTGPKGAAVPAARDVGTTMEVHDLFVHTPVRRKGLASPRAERARCLLVLQQAALVYSQVHFRLVDDEEEVLNVPPHRGAKELLPLLFGSKVAKGMVAVGGGRGAVTVQGHLVAPQDTKGRTQLHLFVNRRPVMDRALVRAVVEGYKPLLERGRAPGGVLFVTLPPRDVDCNVHPAKAEVRFTDHHAVIGTVVVVLRETMGRAELLPSLSLPSAAGRSAPPLGTGASVTPAPLRVEEVLRPRVRPLPLGEAPTAEAGGGAVNWEGIHGPPGQVQVRLDPVQQPMAGGDHQGAVVVAGPQSAAGLPRQVRILGQLGRTYLVAETEDGLVLIDQHAAHEKVTFERLRLQTTGDGPSTQELLQPLTLHCGADHAAAIAQHRSELAALGFVVEPFGPSTFLVRSVPTVLQGFLGEADLLEVVEELAHSGRSELRREHLLEVLHSRACHQAVRGGDPLELPQARRLVEELYGAADPYTCPHGRPTILTVSFGQLEHQFGRRGH